MFNALYLVDLVMIGLVLHLPKFMVYCGFSPGFISIYLSTAKRLAGKSVSDMTYIVSSGTLNLNSINQPGVTVTPEINMVDKKAEVVLVWQVLLTCQ